jgi:hypothetical protein
MKALLGALCAVGLFVTVLAYCEGRNIDTGPLAHDIAAEFQQETNLGCPNPKITIFSRSKTAFNLDLRCDFDGGWQHYTIVWDGGDAWNITVGDTVSR